jgi:hypothetical protein
MIQGGHIQIVLMISGHFGDVADGSGGGIFDG